MFSFGSRLLDFFGYGAHVDGTERSAKENLTEMENYCKPLIFISFFGQASIKGDTDHNTNVGGKNIGTYLKELDIYLRRFPNPKDFNCEKKEFTDILWKIADKRHRIAENEKKCFRRLKRDAKRFEKIYKERAAENPDQSPLSEVLESEDYWGTRQQLLAAKVICDWLCEDEQPPMDPVFGVLFNPTAGRVGPGDSGWMHSLLYDESGEWAHHSAVHDAFGYLINFHEVGPGYNYMYKSFFDKDNPLAGQISGIDFWKDYVEEVQTELKVIDNFKKI